MAASRLSRAVTAWGVLVTLAAGCATTLPPSHSVPEVLEQAAQTGLTKTGELIERTLKEQETFGYVAPGVPVVLPPEIRRVWVLTHVGPDGTLVSGHWVYLRLTDWRWFTETEAKPLRLGTAPAAPAIAPPPQSPPPLPRSSPRGSVPGLPWTPGTPRTGEGVGTGLEQGQVPTVEAPPQLRAAPPPPSGSPGPDPEPPVRPPEGASQ